MKVEIIRQCRRTIPHFFYAGWLYASKGPRVIRTSDLGARWETVGWLYKDWRALSAWLRLSERVFNHGAFNIVRLLDGGLYAITGAQQRFLPPGERLFRQLESPIDYRPMRRGVWVDAEGAVVIADYRNNGGEHRGGRVRDAAHIQRCLDPQADEWERLYSFERGMIRHIHALVPDSIIADRTWIATGDADEESIIAYSDDGLKSIEVFATGSQTARATDLLFTKDYVYWGAETPLEQSGIVRRSREGGEIEWLQTTPCPVYYATSNEAGHFAFSTTVEPGPSISSEYTEIYASTDRDHYKAVWSSRSDRTRQYAQTHFPRGVAPDDLIVWSSIATTRSEATMFVGRLAA